MQYGKSLLFAAAFAAATASSVAGAGTVTGTITFEGEAPNMRPLDMGADPVCKMHHEGEEQPVNEALVLGPNQSMGNIVVKVVGGLPEGKDYPVPEEPFEVTQEGCVYSPHVFVVRAGQPIQFLNPDGTMHNVNGMPEVNRAFNRGMPKNLTEMEITLDQPEELFPIKCDVHPWMRSYAAVVDHPFYDVTEEDGKFTIADLPAGTYELEFTHERLGSKTATVEVPEEGEVTQDMSFERP